MHHHLIPPSFVSIRVIYIYTGRTTVAVPKPTHQPITSQVVSQVTSSSCDLTLHQLWLSLFVWPHLGCIKHVACSHIRSSASTARSPSWAPCHHMWLTSYVCLFVAFIWKHNLWTTLCYVFIIMCFVLFVLSVFCLLDRCFLASKLFMFLLFIRLSCTTLVIYILTDLDDCHRLIAGCGGGVTTCASNWKFLFSHTHTHMHVRVLHFLL